jgi:hypothetical protein
MVTLVAVWPIGIPIGLLGLLWKNWRRNVNQFQISSSGAENERLDKLVTDKGKKETDGYHIGTRLVRKNDSGDNVFGMVVQVVSKTNITPGLTGHNARNAP